MRKTIRRSYRGATILEIVIAIAIIIILCVVSIPGILHGRQDADETGCIGALKAINAAEQSYRGRGSAYGTLAQLQSANMVDPSLGGASVSTAPKEGYYYSLTIVSSVQYWIYALPIVNGGTRVFYTDEAGFVFAALLTVASPGSDCSGSLTSLGANWSEIGN